MSSLTLVSPKNYLNVKHPYILVFSIALFSKDLGYLVLFHPIYNVGGDGTEPLYSKAESVNVPFEVRGQNILKIICK